MYDVRCDGRTMYDVRMYDVTMYACLDVTLNL
jgi:hypothetical protein